jgi:hypothetical protein
MRFHDVLSELNVSVRWRTLAQHVLDFYPRFGS